MRGVKKQRNFAKKYFFLKLFCYLMYYDFLHFLKCFTYLLSVFFSFQRFFFLQHVVNLGLYETLPPQSFLLNRIQKRRKYGLRKKILIKYFTDKQLSYMIRGYNNKFSETFESALDEEQSDDIQVYEDPIYLKKKIFSQLSYFNFSSFFLNSTLKSDYVCEFQDFKKSKSCNFFFFNPLKWAGFFFFNSAFFCKLDKIQVQQVHDTFLYKFSIIFFFSKKIFFNEKTKSYKRPKNLVSLVDNCLTNIKLSTKGARSVLTKTDNYLFDKFFINFLKLFFSQITISENMFSKSMGLSTKFFSLLLFLPDNFFFLQSAGFSFSTADLRIKYYNITPLLNISLAFELKKKKNTLYKDNQIFLWYLVQFFETNFKKPVFLKLLYGRSIFKNSEVYTVCFRIFKKFRKYIFRFKRNFYLGEIIRVAALSLLSKDATLLLNLVIWVLMHIPYRDVKPFLYFLKIILKQYLLPAFKMLGALCGFIFDIRGKVGVTGDAKKRHTLISWGQTSFSRKELKLSLKQGLVYTRTGVMGVTVIIIS